MVLAFTQYLKDGTQTNFVAKILACDYRGLCNLQINPDLEPYFRHLLFTTYVRPKLHTIRKKSGRWKPWRLIHFTINNRTPEQQQFAQGVCTSVQTLKIVITREEMAEGVVMASWSLYCDDRVMTMSEVEELAANDGLSMDQFLKFFGGDLKHPVTVTEYDIIHWTEKKY